MNRRELFKGFAAVCVAASIPFDVEALITVPDSDVTKYLKTVKDDLMNKIIYPPAIMSEDGTLTMMSTDGWVEALRHINILLKELNA